MNEIKTFYNQRKEKYEQRSQENAVECNIINLNLRKPSKILKYKNESDKNSLNYNKESKLNSNSKDIGINALPVFGRTTYNSYNKKDVNVGTHNKKRNGLKDNLNKAMMSSIKKKVLLVDKDIST